MNDKIAPLKTPLGRLPDSWKLAKLKEITVKIGSGATPRGGDKVYLPNRENFALIRSQNVFDRYFSDEGLAFISDKHAEQLKPVWLQPNDVLLNITGDGITFSRACIIPEEMLPACVNQHVSIIRTNPDLCHPGYLLSYLTHPLIKRYIESFNSGGSRRAITKGHIESFVIPLPTLPEQRAIAHILGSLDDKIELNRQMNQTLEEMARALFKAWFIDFEPVRAKAAGLPPTSADPATAALFPDRLVESELGPVPEGWRIAKFSEVCMVGRGASPRPIQDFLGGTVPWIKIADATNANGPYLFETKEKIKEEGVEKSVFLEKGSLILSNSATCGVPIFLDIDGCIHDGWLYFRNLQGISPNYLYHILVKLADHLVHIADGSVQKNLNTNLIGSQAILIPAQDVLDKFDTITKPIFNKILENGREIRTLTELRDTLLPKLISGQVRVGGEG